jgi:hypothetical protein
MLLGLGVKNKFPFLKTTLEMLFLCMCLYHWYISHEEQLVLRVRKKKLSVVEVGFLLLPERKLNS